MANHCYHNLLGAMDLLWFHHIILFSEPITILSLKTTKPISETPVSSLSSQNLPSSTPSENEISSASSASTTQDDLYNKEEESRPTRLKIATTKIRAQSSSPLVKKIPNRHRYSGSADGEGRRLRRTKSCKSLWELEYEELKGFNDLGFEFKKELVTPRMMSVIPGLQRLEEYQFADEAPKEDEFEVDRKEEKRGVMRPYLSEAWLIKRPDSPLLNLKIPRASAAADMKKHLRFWARTVAAVIQQES
ncbi:uncharacterized protein LOC122082625 [Macadamia integrifolia]|uniref:uncharacterized protein LOC122082625 n=1 Tax=Macadamia integrifolia TaxID=60698 RepID=UPI001C4FF642|nr:uncharacterized protein LOC122082625 [Macadamia integrifolia]